MASIRRKELLKDEDLLKIYENICIDGEMGEGQIVYKWWGEGKAIRGRYKNSINWIMVVPDRLLPIIVRIFHEGLGHPGKQRSIKTMQLKYIFENMYKKMSIYIKKCVHCMKRKVYRRYAKPPIQKYQCPPYPFFRCHVDLTGPFPKSKNGNKYILVLKCALTKWVEIFALIDKTAESVAECIVEEVICRYGIINVLISDKGGEFNNELMDQIKLLLRIRRISTTPYNPRSDGLAENHMHTLKDQLSAYVNKATDNWDEFLPVVALAYRTTVCDSTGYTPYYALFGREAKLISESWIEEFIKQKGLTEYVKDIVRTLRTTWDYISHRVDGNHIRMNTIPRKRLEYREYEVGDEIYVKVRPRRIYKSLIDEEKYQIASKLQMRYEGPYIVIGKINPVLFEVKGNGEDSFRVSAVNMKPGVRKGVIEET